MRSLIGISEAAAICNVSGPLMRHRVLRGDLPIARYNPVRLRADLVLDYAKNRPSTRRYTKQPTVLDELATKFATITTR